MLSLNFYLVRKSSLFKLDKAILAYIFAIFFVDFYDTSLYIGYAIYLHSVVFPGLNIYEATIKFAIIFALVQIFKISGFILYSYVMPYQRKLVYFPLVLFIISSIGLAFFWVFGTINEKTIYLFLALRLLQALAIGAEICFTLKITNTIALSEHTKAAMYYFILFAGECGIFVSVFINRYLLSHGITIEEFMNAWRVQLLFSALLALVSVYLKQRHVHKYIYNSFSQKVFFTTVARYWKLILIRSGIGAYSFLLIVIVIMRTPHILELDYGWSHAAINKILLVVTIVGFLGTNLAYFLSKYFEPFKLILVAYLSHMVLNCYFYYVNALDNDITYAMWIIVTGFFYGVFLRLTPIFLNSVNDFKNRNRLIGRYISYFVVYTICSAIVVLSLDFMHYIHHIIHHDGNLVRVPILFILICNLIGIISILIYRPYHQINYNHKWDFKS